MATHQKRHNKNSAKSRELIEPDNSIGEEYAILGTCNGGTRFNVTLLKDRKELVASVKKSLCFGRKKVRFNKGDLIIIQPDGMTKPSYYIIHKFTEEEFRKLRADNKIEFIETNNEDGDVNITFGQSSASSASSSSIVLMKDEDITDDMIDNL
jgi:translation initiation factor IF-1